MLEKDYVILVFLSGKILKIKEGELSDFLAGDSLDLGIITYRVFYQGHHIEEVIERVYLTETLITIIRSIRVASVDLLTNFSFDWKKLIVVGKCKYKICKRQFSSNLLSNI